jgi:hypothetical protein
MAQCCPALPHGRFLTSTRSRACWSLPCLVTLRFATCWALSNWPGVGACCSPLGYCIVDKSEPQLALNIIQHLFHSDLSLKVQECQDIDIKHPHTQIYIYIQYNIYIYHCFIYNWAWVKSFLLTSSNITLIIPSEVPGDLLLSRPAELSSQNQSGKEEQNWTNYVQPGSINALFTTIIYHEILDL